MRFNFVFNRINIFAMIAVCFSSVSGLIPAVVSILIGQCFQILEKLAKGEYENHQFRDDLIIRTMSLLIVAAGAIPIGWCAITCWMMYGERINDFLRSKLLETYKQLPLSWYDKNEKLEGDFIQFSRCIEEVRAGVSEAAAIMVQSIISAIALIGTSLYYSWSLTLVILCSTPIMAIVAFALSRLIEKHTAAENEYSSYAAKDLEWVFKSSKLIRLLQKENYELSKFRKHIYACSESFNKMNLLQSIHYSFIRFFTLCMFVQGFWFGNVMIHKRKVHPSNVITCFSSCLMLGQTVTYILSNLLIIQKAKMANNRLQCFFKNKLLKKIDQPIYIGPGDIIFENVSFTYPTRPTPVLNNVSLKFKSGQLCFVVGKSGSGKSTLVNLLLQLYDIQSGCIKINHIPVQKINSNWLYQLIYFVEQTSTLFSGTIRENIIGGSTGNLDFACQISLLQRTLLSFPKGIDTHISKDSLSGGQQQRVAIARAVIKDPPILILDESFSALDTSQRSLLMDAIRFWRSKKTTIILTHEVSLIHDNEPVYVMKDGKVSEFGTKTMLLRNRKEFFKLASNERLTKCKETTIANNDKIKRPSLKQRVDPEKELSTLLDCKEKGHQHFLSLKSIIYKMYTMIDRKLILCCGIFCSMIAGISSPVFSYSFSKLLNGITNAINSAKWSGIVIGIAACDSLFNFGKNLILHCVAERWVVILRLEGMRILLGLPIRSLESAPTVITMLMNDLRDLRTLASDFLSVTSTVLIVSIVGLVWSFVVGWKLAFVFVSLFPVFLIISTVFGIQIKDLENNYKSSIASMESQMFEIVTSMKTIRILRLDYLFSNYNNAAQQLQSVAVKRAIAIGFGISLTNALVIVMQGISLYYGLKLVGTGDYTPAKMFETFSLLLFTIMTCVALVGQMPDISRGQRAATLCLELIKKQIPDSRRGLIPVSNQISIKNVSFAYQQPLFQSLTFDILPGECVGIIRESGSGKSTFALLLANLYTPSNGTIEVGNIPLKEIDNSWFRQQIALVEQKPTIMDDTIRANMQYAKADATEKEIWQALELAQADEFCSSIGLDSRVDTSLLSGGQLQRLSLARALLHRPSILILDECTSALDTENTNYICQLVQKLQHQMTVIVITHSEPMMRSCSRLVVLRQGTIVESGSFDTLYSTKGELFKIIHSL